MLRAVTSGKQEARDDMLGGLRQFMAKGTSGPLDRAREVSGRVEHQARVLASEAGTRGTASEGSSRLRSSRRAFP